MSTTRTIGPLHLEDLEPHRFEDLIRQLIYDFRNWRSLEATGRGGADDGFDARATEIVPQYDADEISAGDDADEDAERTAPPSQDRTWLIQCKREKAINPKKLLRYLDDIPEKERFSLYGIIFAAACDFSKAARDAFRARVRELGFAEAQLWGKGEIEDMLFQPKNDPLLFAYFGISLQTRKRSLKTAVRSRLAMKRKAQRLNLDYRSVLIRDASDDRYPYLDPSKEKPRVERGRWSVWNVRGCFHDGIRLVCGRHFAYLSDDGEAWDYADTMNDARLASYANPWRDENDDQEERESRDEALTIWQSLPEQNRAWFEVSGVIPYDNILDIDEKGDDFFAGPQIYVAEFDLSRGPFQGGYYTTLETMAPAESRVGNAEPDRRIERFPRGT